MDCDATCSASAAATSFVSTWMSTAYCDTKQLACQASQTVASFYPPVTHLLNSVLTGAPSSPSPPPLTQTLLEVDSLDALLSALKQTSLHLKTTAADAAGHASNTAPTQYLLTLKTSALTAASSLPQTFPPLVLSKISTIQSSAQTYRTWFLDVLQANVGMPILILRSLSIYLLFLLILTIIPGFTHGWSGRLLRWPILFLTYFQITIELILYTVLRLTIRVMEGVFQSRTHRRMRGGIWRAKDYDDWLERTRELDESQGRDWWQRTVADEVGSRYNWAFIRELMRDLKNARSNGDTAKALDVLQMCTRKNVGGVMSNELFAFTNSGEPKFIVKEFVGEVCKTISWITEECVDEENKQTEEKKNEDEEAAASLLNSLTLGLLGDPGTPKRGSPVTESPSFSPDTPTSPPRPPKSKSSRLPHSQKRAHIQQFLKRARAAYGRTALVLSGGAAMGTYHFGVVKALYDEGILPHILSGTSAGAVVGAFIGTRTDAEIERDLNVETLELKLRSFGKGWVDLATNLLNHGTLFENDYWMQQIDFFSSGDLTFEEAYKKTGRILCITLSATTKKAPPVLLNYVTSPHITIASAVCASAAVPGFVKAMRLQIKGEDGVVRIQDENKDQLYYDGSIEQDIPTNGLAEMFNCQFFLAAQANPHIVPFFYNNKGDVGRPSRWSIGHREDSWRGGFLLSALELYLKIDMKAKFQFLADLEAAVGFTGTLMTQNNWGNDKNEGLTTMVPQVAFQDYFKLISDPKKKDLERYLQGGQVAAWEKTSLMKTHYSIAHTLNECLAKLAEVDGGTDVPREATFDRKQDERRRSKGKIPSFSGVAKFSPNPVVPSHSAFTFATIEENEELDLPTDPYSKK
ncbi:hypothetical protein TrVE_jg12350 [Triparma verrucosa]|uniref:PNPLA domain-containing protein n=1 Tax=Triparma verrucosa TaxID=1606542 RepID=A0A9W7BHC9_9STRA|nr:hypothetical protein TrVE_jg12350 [Triparma verrucosa]